MLVKLQGMDDRLHTAASRAQTVDLLRDVIVRTVLEGLAELTKMFSGPLAIDCHCFWMGKRLEQLAWKFFNAREIWLASLYPPPRR